VSTVLVDPAVPGPIRDVLKRAPTAALIRFAAPSPGVVPPLGRVHPLLAALVIRTDDIGEVLPSEQALAHATTAYHRRYLVPDRDFQGEYRTTWQLTRQVADIIERSEVVRLGLIDSIRVAAVLPYHLWDIASRLAMLSGTQQEQLNASGFAADEIRLVITEADGAVRRANEAGQGLVGASGANR
jgi:hypothetical protein